MSLRSVVWIISSSFFYHILHQNQTLFYTITYINHTLIFPSPIVVPCEIYLWFILSKLLNVSNTNKPFLDPRYVWKIWCMQQLQFWDSTLLWAPVLNHNCAIECRRRKHPITRNYWIPPTHKCRGIDLKKQSIPL